MRKVFVVFIFIIALTFNILAQMQEARKVNEFGFIPCGYFNALMDSMYRDYKNSPNFKIYVIYYKELNHASDGKWNEKTKSFEDTKLSNPKRGDAVNRTKEVPLYFKTRV